MTINVSRSNFSLRHVGKLVATLLQSPANKLSSLSLKFFDNDWRSQRPGDWCHFAGLIAHALQGNEWIQTLDLCFIEPSIMISSLPDSKAPVMLSEAFQALFEDLLSNHNTVLGSLHICTPTHTVRFSSTIDFYLALNRAGRHQWLLHNETLTDEQCCDLLSQAQRIFPNDEACQVSMLFHWLSIKPFVVVN